MAEENVKGPEETQKDKSTEYDPVRETGVVLDRIYSEVKAIGEGQAQLHHKIDGVRTELKQDINNLDQKMQVGFNTVNNRLDKVESRLDRVESELTSVKHAVMDIKDDVKKHDEKLSHL